MGKFDLCVCGHKRYNHKPAIPQLKRKGYVSVCSNCNPISECKCFVLDMAVVV